MGFIFFRSLLGKHFSMIIMSKYFHFLKFNLKLNLSNEAFVHLEDFLHGYKQKRAFLSLATLFFVEPIQNQEQYIKRELCDNSVIRIRKCVRKVQNMSDHNHRCTIIIFLRFVMFYSSNKNNSPNLVRTSVNVIKIMVLKNCRKKLTFL